MEDLILTPKQDQKMLEIWNKNPNDPPSLKDITKAVFDRECDGRSKEGKAIKKALSQHNLRARPAQDYQAKMNEVELDDDKKSYISNNASTMTAVEMARILFDNPNLTNLHAETRTVNDYIKTLDTRIVYNNGENTNEVPMEGYKPPKTFDAVFKRVNSFINFVLDKSKLSIQQKKGLEALINYLHTYRFVKQIETYDTQSDRKSLEDAFIRYTYDKPDLSQEEVDQYIMLSHEVVSSFKIQRRMEHLQGMLENITETNPDNARISMSLVDAINTANNEHHQCVIRQQKLLDDLKEKRSSRLSKEIKDNASILNLVQLWKYEESRKKLLKLAELEQQVVDKEIDNLSNMDDIRAKILGLTKDEIKYG